ncbi:hypothetical protein LPB86_17510 [Pedobacter sp. MC2016-14]|uniref:hypothetical protein n=1 Tax=Pedobacter sp. MC2016-14 TaxID=2897327 RepID=UPI001E3426C1|nr:hypothetical protein [Pedobacter sp. MC2016-14]MCD0490042.1 hypothetical protein [Pedobacter sp. MC2016-14]
MYKLHTIALIAFTFCLFNASAQKISAVEKKAAGKLPQLNDQFVSAAKRCFDQFIVKLREGDIEGAKTFLAPQVRNMMTATVFSKLSSFVKPGPFKIYTHRVEDFKGINYLAIQFTYANAPEKPTDFMKVLFDQDNLIISVQPLMMKEPHG